MPRNKRHGALSPKADKTDNDNEENGTVTTATASDETTAVEDEDGDDAVTFPLESFQAPEDYAPNRKTPGRTRRPSYFDDILRDPSVYEKGYQMVPVTSEDHKAFVVRELNRAKLYLNGVGRKEGEPEIGLALDLDNDDAVYYRSREAQKRERKEKTGEDAGANALAEGQDEVDPDGDNDE